MNTNTLALISIHMVTLSHLVKGEGLHLAQIDNHVEDIMESISLGNPWQPNHIKNNI